MLGPEKRWAEAEKESADFVKLIEEGEHVILFYTGIEDKHDVLFTFIKIGLDRGEAAVYVTSEEASRQIREAMVKFGIDVKSYEENGGLKILDYKDVYFVKGRFDALKTRRLWDRLYDEAVRRGFKGMRVVGEVSCFFEAGLVKELLEYERSIGPRFKIRMTAICAYNTEVVNRVNMTELILGLIEAHCRAGLSRRSLRHLKIHRILSKIRDKSECGVYRSCESPYTRDDHNSSM